MEKNRDMKNSYVFKGALVACVLLSMALTLTGILGSAYLSWAGLFFDEKQGASNMLSSITEYYETRALSDHVKKEDKLPKDSNFHYIIYEGAKADTKASLTDKVKENKAGDLKVVGGNIEIIPADADSTIFVTRCGEYSQFVMGNTTEMGAFVSPYMYADIRSGEKQIKHTLDGYGLSKDKKTAYVKEGDVWFPLDPLLDDPMVVLQVNTGDNQAKEYYSLSNVRMDWFCKAYGVDEKDVEILYDFGSDNLIPESEIAVPGAKDEISDITVFDIQSDGEFTTGEEDDTEKLYAVNCYYGSKNAANASDMAGIIKDEYKIDLGCNDLYAKAADQLDTLIAWRVPFVMLAILGLILGIVSYVFFLSAAGHHNAPHPKAKEKNYIMSENGLGVIEKRALDLIPVDLYFFIICGISLGIIGISESIPSIVTLAAVVLPFLVLVWFVFSISVAVNIKVGGIHKNTLIYMAIGLIAKGLEKVGALWNQEEGVKGLRKRAWITYGVLFVLNFLAFNILADSTHSDIRIVFTLCFLGMWGFIAWMLLKCLAGLARIKEGAALVAEGDLSHKIDVSGLPADLASMANDINHIGSGLDAAVEERMKSDRMQTELITNVSHDIRTPLTSIVNYVDLLSKEDLDNEKAKEYIEVLSRQSLRLKKLISDLIDASKASSGTMKLNMERINASVLLSQAVGEYSEKLDAKQIKMVVASDDEEMYIKADSQRLWRVFDNLLGNTVKYGQEGTRAYVDVLRSEDGNNISMVFRNISASQLHISGDELMKRFVRGDASRSTEGSGLGLSIARSLTELMRGNFDLTIDGDLFKVTLTFPADK